MWQKSTFMKAVKIAFLVDALLAAGAVIGDDQGCDGEIMRGSMKVQGLSQTMYLAGNNGSALGNDITLRHNAGLTMFSKCEDDWEPESFAQLKLLGKAISFKVDLSRAGCACNVAFYLIAAPALGPVGEPSRGSDREGQPPYYCDANKVGGQWCPEIDIMEANNHAFQATSHKCDAPTNGHYRSCDRDGSAHSSRDQPSAYGPGSEYTIDTTLPFTVRTEFPEDNGVLTGMLTTLGQGGRRFVLSNSSSVSRLYLEQLSDAMKDGMSVRITYWGSSYTQMSWMDAPLCGLENCTGENAGDIVISDLAVSDASGPQPASADSSLAAPEPKEEHVIWASAAAAADVEPETHWASNIYAPWQCHQFVSWEQQQSDWCQTVGFEAGFEYSFNGGMNSPCGDCWCCKREAKKVASAAPPSTTGAPTATIAATSAALATTNAEPASTSAEPLLVWVVSERSDPLFGRELPEYVASDPRRFVGLHGTGVARWMHTLHTVKLMDASEVAAFAGSATRAPEQGGWRGPFVFGGMLLQKYRITPLPGLARRWNLGSTALAVSLMMLACASAVFLVRRARRHHVPHAPSLLALGSAMADPRRRSPHGCDDGNELQELLATQGAAAVV